MLAWIALSVPVALLAGALCRTADRGGGVRSCRGAAAGRGARTPLGARHLRSV